MRLSLWTRKRFFFGTLKGRQLPEPLPPLFFLLSCCNQRRKPREASKSIHCSSVSVLACYKIPAPPPCSRCQFPFLSAKKIILEKKGEGDKRRGEVSLPSPALLCCPAHLRPWPPRRGGACSRSCCSRWRWSRRWCGRTRWRGAGRSRRRPPPPSSRSTATSTLTGALRSPCPATHLSPFRAVSVPAPFPTPDSENQLTDRLLIASVD
jgi:hypothetical protein